MIRESVIAMKRTTPLAVHIPIVFRRQACCLIGGFIVGVLYFIKTRDRWEECRGETGSEPSWDAEIRGHGNFLVSAVSAVEEAHHPMLSCRQCLHEFILVHQVFAPQASHGGFFTARRTAPRLTEFREYWQVFRKYDGKVRESNAPVFAKAPRRRITEFTHTDKPNWLILTPASGVGIESNEAEHEGSTVVRSVPFCNCFGKAALRMDQFLKDSCGKRGKRENVAESH